MHSNNHILQERNNEIQKPIKSTQGIPEEDKGMKEREDNVGCLDCDYYMMHVFGGHYHEDCLISELLHTPDCTKYKRGEVLVAPWNKGHENENMKEGYDKIKNFFENI